MMVAGHLLHSCLMGVLGVICNITFLSIKKLTGKKY